VSDDHAVQGLDDVVQGAACDVAVGGEEEEGERGVVRQRQRDMLGKGRAGQGREREREGEKF
jgi:hypothetical protein